jgi:hypothetical protein
LPQWKLRHWGYALGEYDTLGWINFHISLSNMQYMYIIKERY